MLIKKQRESSPGLLSMLLCPHDLLFFLETQTTNRKNSLPFASRRGQEHTPKQERTSSQTTAKGVRRIYAFFVYLPTIVYSVSPTPPRDCKTNNPDGQLSSSVKFNFCIGKESGRNVFAVVGIEKTAQ
ncbi:hypothetical protein CDAR_396541 [Caerostris darwini]|uniref:Uncharacterized protein n=1 Tax=Caerostris darwini TaxID=1538125 RepID=A0AAV4PPT3_9ARAC|nr:hypothetical protein CDAR_396541 [Caerostris darwini]